MAGAQSHADSDPAPLLGLLEGPRFLLELQAFFVFAPWLMSAPKGDGHPVLILPGLSATDNSTFLIRQFLKTRGYRTYGWDAGVNRGLRLAGGVDGMRKRISSLAEKHGRKISLVGFSIGGSQAQRLAALEPSAVRRVISVGAPLAPPEPELKPTWRLYENVGGQVVGRDVVRSLVAVAAQPLPMHCVSVYSRSDGIIGDLHSYLRQGSSARSIEGQGTAESSRELLEVVSGHYGMLVNPAVFHALADRLAQPEQNWRPFSAQGLKRPLFPRRAQLP